MWRPIIWCWFPFFCLAIKSVLKFRHWYRSWNPQHGGRGRSEMLAFSQKIKSTACQVDTNSRLAKKLYQEKAYEPKLRPKIEFTGIYVPLCYESLLGRVMDFPSRVQVVKKIPSTVWVASTRYSLSVDHSSQKLWPVTDFLNFALCKSFEHVRGSGGDRKNDFWAKRLF